MVVFPVKCARVPHSEEMNQPISLEMTVPSRDIETGNTQKKTPAIGGSILLYAGDSSTSTRSSSSSCSRWCRLRCRRPVSPDAQIRFPSTKLLSGGFWMDVDDDFVHDDFVELGVARLRSPLTEVDCGSKSCGSKGWWTLLGCGRPRILGCCRDASLDGEGDHPFPPGAPYASLSKTGQTVCHPERREGWWWWWESFRQRDVSWWESFRQRDISEALPHSSRAAALPCCGSLLSGRARAIETDVSGIFVKRPPSLVCRFRRLLCARKRVLCVYLLLLLFFFCQLLLQSAEARP